MQKEIKVHGISGFANIEKKDVIIASENILKIIQKRRQRERRKIIEEIKTRYEKINRWIRELTLNIVKLHAIEDVKIGEIIDIQYNRQIEEIDADLERLAHTVLYAAKQNGISSPLSLTLETIQQLQIKI